MFAGVAASSMPTVNQFFTREKFLFKSWRSSLRPRLTHLLSRSRSVKLLDYYPSFTNWGGSKTHTSEDREGFRMNDLELNSCERKAAKAPQVEDS